MLKKQPQKMMSICGWKNSGKTTLITSLIPFFLNMGLRVGVIKKTHHLIIKDDHGKDSMLYQEAGASSAALVSDKSWKLMHNLQTHQTTDQAICAIMACMDEDIILLEGHKFSSFPKIVVFAPEKNDNGLIQCSWPGVVGFASDEKPDFLTFDLAWCRRDDMAALATIILERGLEI